jgi:hypothetical protein
MSLREIDVSTTDFISITNVTLAPRIDEYNQWAQYINGLLTPIGEALNSVSDVLLEIRSYVEDDLPNALAVEGNADTRGWAYELEQLKAGLLSAHQDLDQLRQIV